MDTRDDLKVVTPVAFIKGHPAMFLPGGVVSGEILVGRLIADILVKPSQPAYAIRVGPWWVVASDQDWIPHGQGDPFTQIVPFPEAGPNAMHAEILITAFAQHVITSDGLTVRNVKGEPCDHPSDLPRHHPEWRRRVAFRM